MPAYHAIEAAGSPGLGMRRGGAAGDEQVEAVGGIEQARGGAGPIGAAVLPDDPPGGGVDHHDTVTVVVVDADESARQPFGQARVVQHGRAAAWAVDPTEMTFPSELHDPAGSSVVGDEVQIATELLRVGGVGDREMNAPDQAPARGDLVDP